MDVQADQDHNIWIVNQYGINRYDGHDFLGVAVDGVNFSVFLRFFESALGERFVMDMSNQIFFIESDTLRAFEMNDTLRSMSKGKVFTDVFIDRNRCVHLSIPKIGYLTIDSSSTMRFPLKEMETPVCGVASFFVEGRAPFTVFQDLPNSECDRQKQHYLFDEDRKLIGQFPNNSLNHIRLLSQTQLSNGNYLLSTGSGELTEFNREGLVANYPCDLSIIKLFTDRSGHLWLSTRENGVHFYEKGASLLEAGERVVDDQYCSVTTADFQGGIWAASKNIGLNRIGFPHFRHQPSTVELSAPSRVRGLEVVGDKLFFATNDNKIQSIDLRDLKLDTGALSKSELGLLDFQYDARYDRFWIAYRGGMAYWEDGGWHRLSLKDMPWHRSTTSYSFLRRSSTTDSIPLIGRVKNRFFYIQDTAVSYVSPAYSDAVFCILPLGDTTWVSTINGVYLQTPDTTIDLAKQYPLLKASFRNMVYFQKRVWLVSDKNGLLVMQPDGPIQVKYKGKKVALGMLIPKSADELWVFSTLGTMVFSTKGEPNHFTGTHLSVHIRVVPHSMYYHAMNDSAMFFLGEKSIQWTSFENMVRHSVVPPHLSIRNVGINDANYSGKDSVFRLDQVDNFIQVSYVGVRFGRKKVRYRYRMNGLMDSWKETNETSLQFIQLPAGTYNLELQAQLAGEPWGRSKHISFYIPRPFWQTWWFLSLSFLLLLTIGFLISRNRIQANNREKNLVISRLSAEQKALRAKMDPHFVFNVITSAQYLILMKENEKAINFLQIFSRLMRNVLDQSNLSSISLENELTSLREYIELEHFRLEEQFEYQIHVDDSIALQTEKTIPFVLQPFVENAIHHGLKYKQGLGKLKLSLKTEDEFLRIEIEDDGIGRAASKKLKTAEKAKQQSHGIQIVKDRLRLHNGNGRKSDTIIDDLMDELGNAIGTRVTIFIKRMTV